MSESIGQTFLVDTLSWNGIVSTGIFLTKIDIYFATKDPVQPVFVNICEIDPLTGAFTGRILPFSSKSRTSAQINTSADGSNPTPFVFPAPVYLLDGKEYGFQIIPGGGSPNFTVFRPKKFVARFKLATASFHFGNLEFLVKTKVFIQNLA